MKIWFLVNLVLAAVCAILIILLQSGSVIYFQYLPSIGIINYVINGAVSLSVFVAAIAYLFRQNQERLLTRYLILTFLVYILPSLLASIRIFFIFSSLPHYGR